MYLHIGQDFVVNLKDIVAIFDFENTSVSKITREFLIGSNKKKEVVYLNDELPKSFILAENKRKSTVYISSLSSATLVKRANSGGFHF